MSSSSSGNKMSLYPSRSDYQLFYCCNDYPPKPVPNGTSRRAQAWATRASLPHHLHPTDQLGPCCSTPPAGRDPMDIRLMLTAPSPGAAQHQPRRRRAAHRILPASHPLRRPTPTTTACPTPGETAKGLSPNVANTNARTLSSASYRPRGLPERGFPASRITGWAG